MINYYLIQPFSQVILTCKRQTDCLVNKYCNLLKECLDCNYITKNRCDSLTGCCNEFFYEQCPHSSYICHSLKKNNNTFNGIDIFLYFFIVFTITYLFTGCYYNIYMHNARGWNVIPHKNYWKRLFELVRDGFYFTYSKIKTKIDDQYNRIES